MLTKRRSKTPITPATFPLGPPNLGGRSKNFVQRSMNAVETDKDVIWSPWTWRTWSNFGHVQKKRSEDVVESGRSKNLIRT